MVAVGGAWRAARRQVGVRGGLGGGAWGPPSRSARHARPPPSLPPHPHRFSKQKSEAERALQRKGRVWLLCAGAAIAAYVLLSGQYIQLELWDTEEYEEEEEE